MEFVLVRGERRRSVSRLGYVARVLCSGTWCLTLGAACAVSLAACSEHDVTIASGIADSAVLLPPPPGETPLPPASTVPPPMEPAPPAPAFGATSAPPLTPPPPAPVSRAPDSSPQEPALVLKCDALPEAPLVFQALPGFATSEDFAFDAQGNYVGIDRDQNLVRISKDGVKQLWAPGTGSSAGMAVLPDGSLVYCRVDTGELRRVYANGANTVVLGGLAYPNGMTLGPDGFVYVAENAAGRVRRVNPDTGEFTVVALGLYGPNGVSFGPDPGILYVGSFEGAGVYRVDMAAPGQLGSARVFANTPSSRLPEPTALCRDLQEGDVCQDAWHQSARCQTLANVVDCVAIDPCPELPDGRLCDYPIYGECQAGHCVEVPDACETGQAGDVCHIAGAGDGLCQLFVPEVVEGEVPAEEQGEPVLYCEIPNPCAGHAVGDVCNDPFFDVDGVCTDYGIGELQCGPRNPCDGLQVGDACVDEVGDFSGTCGDLDGTVYCQAPTGCEGKQAADPCQDPLSEIEGHCADYDGTLYCLGPTGCEDKQLLDPCQDPLSEYRGVCIRYADSGPLLCGSATGCEGKRPADACEEPTSHVQGFCIDSGGYVYCAEPTGCEGKAVGDVCSDAGGHCASQDGVAQDGAAPDGGVPVGVAPDGPLYCELSCEGKPDGDPCQSYYSTHGYCFQNECMPLYPAGSGIDGLGVDACGNVYATEFTSGIVWRIDPEGQLEQLVRLPSSWIPNVKWGHDVGGFSSTTMYVADLDSGRLFALPVGVPSAEAVLKRGAEQ